MKNVFTKSVIAASVFSVFAASAGTLDVANGAGSLFAHDADGTTVGALTRAVIVSKELIDNSADEDESLINRTLNGDVTATADGAYDTRVLQYSSPVDLKAKSTLVFTFTGGTVKKNTALALLRSVGGNFEAAGTVTDFTADADGNYTSVKFQLSDGITGDQVNADEVLVLGESGDDGAAAAIANLTQPTFILGEGSTSLSVAVNEVRDDNAQLLNAPKASSETIASVISQFEFKVTKNTDKIDVDQDRLFFTDGTGDDESAGSIGVNETATTWATGNKGFPTTAGVTFTVSGTQDAITDIDGSSIGALAYDEDDNVWTDTMAALSTLITTDETITATVDGETEVEEATYPVTVKIAATTVGGEYGDTKAFMPIDGSTLLDWKLNAATATIPYMPFGANITPIVYLTNKGSSEGRIFVDVWAQDGTKVVTNEQLTGMTIGNGISYLSQQIADLVKGKADNQKVTIKVIAEIPQDEMEVYSAYNVNGSDRGLVINDSNTVTNRD